MPNGRAPVNLANRFAFFQNLMSPPVDPANPLSVLTYRELLANRAMARKRLRGRPGAAGMVARIDAELERRRELRGTVLFRSVPSIVALDETSGYSSGKGKR